MFAAVLAILAAAPVPPPPPPAPLSEHVIILMLDGVRPDVLRRVRAPNMQRLAQEGADFSRATTVYPSQTRVAFVSLPTGSYPDGHGVVGGDDYLDANWNAIDLGEENPLGSQALCMRPTFFEETTAAGLTSLYAAMKGYELVGARGATITINGKETIDRSVWATRYNMEVAGSRERALWDKLAMSRDLLRQSLTVIRERRPALAIINLGSADYAAHSWGPGVEYERAVEFIDGLVGELLATLRETGMLERTTLVVSADHGFTPITPRQVVAPVDEGSGHALAELTARGIEHWVTNTGGISMGVYVRDNARVPEVASYLRAQSWADGIYCEVPAAKCDRTLSSLRAYFPGRSPDLMVDLDDDVSLHRPREGNHGSLRTTDTRIPLFFWGAGIAKAKIRGGASLVDVAPTALRLLGLTPHVMKLDGRVLDEALAPPVRPLPGE